MLFANICVEVYHTTGFLWTLNDTELAKQSTQTHTHTHQQIFISTVITELIFLSSTFLIK